MFKVYDEKSEEVYLTLISFSGGIELCAVDRTGKAMKQGNILSILQSGGIKLTVAVNPDLGFQLDEKGRVKIV